MLADGVVLQIQKKMEHDIRRWPIPRNFRKVWYESLGLATQTEKYFHKMVWLQLDQILLSIIQSQAFNFAVHIITQKIVYKYTQ